MKFYCLEIRRKTNTFLGWVGASFSNRISSSVRLEGEVPYGTGLVMVKSVEGVGSSKIVTASAGSNSL